jgi:hypothetical protein
MVVSLPMLSLVWVRWRGRRSGEGVGCLPMVSRRAARWASRSVISLMRCRAAWVSDWERTSSSMIEFSPGNGSRRVGR